MYNLEVGYSHLIVLSQNAYNRLLEAKNLHCVKVVCIIKQSRHRLFQITLMRIFMVYTWNWCYKKYTMIISKCKCKSTSNIEQPKIKTTQKSLECSSTLTPPFTGVKLIPKYCFFCEQTRKKFKEKEQLVLSRHQKMR